MTGSKSGFMICPVAGDPAGELSRQYVERLEADGWRIHWPHRDTDQRDDTGLRICRDNFMAIEAADRVFVVWDGKSRGCLFDLGMSFALDKPITWLKLPDKTDGKSFENMVRAWEESCRRP